MAFSPTQEQLEILRAAKENKKLKIDAKAGSGKTSTLVLLANDNLERSLYLTFNKNMAEEAKKKFPDHVEVRTSHSLAYEGFGSKIAHKLFRPKGEYQNVCGTGAEIARHYKIAPYVVTADKSISGTAMGYAVKSTVGRFEFSGDEELSEKHVSYLEAEKLLDNPRFDKRDFAKRVLKFAKLLWKDRIDMSSPILATHDTYLKLYQLSKPDLGKYKLLYLDESQDSSACLLDIVHNQKGRVIMVGDTYQAIYAWRGAVNAMENTNWPTRSLTKSFRFGQEVAEVAKDILLNKFGERKAEISGFEKISTQVVTQNKDTEYTWLFRTNAALIGCAVDLIERGVEVNVEVDIRDFQSLMVSALALRAGNLKNVKHHDLVSFNSWEEFEEDVQVSKRGELKRVYGYISGGVASHILKVLENYKPNKKAKITLITAHKAKGLEYDVVVLADDFPEYDLSEDGEWFGWNGQERNLLYVAATRAKKKLVINTLIQDLKLWIKQKDMKYEHVQRAA